MAALDRIDVRLPRQEKAFYQRAADLSGLSMSDFIRQSAQEKAEATIRRHEVLTLSARDSQLVVETLLEPPAPMARDGVAGGRAKRAGSDHHGEGQSSRATGQAPGMAMRLLGSAGHRQGLDSPRRPRYDRRLIIISSYNSMNWSIQR